MNKKQMQEWVNKQVAKWKPRLLLNNWAVTVTMADEDIDVSEDVSFQATMQVNSVYTDSIMTIYPALFNKPTGYKQSTVVHELLHIPVHPINQALNQAVKKGVISDKKRQELVEGLTEYIAKLMFVAYTKRTQQSKDSYHV